MEKMEHFREGRLLKDEQVVIEKIDGHLGCHLKSQGRKQWFGYFELRSDQHVPAGSHYRLELADGRVAEINASDVQNSNVAGTDLHIAEFYVVGEVRSPRRGLREGNGKRNYLA